MRAALIAALRHSATLAYAEAASTANLTHRRRVMALAETLVAQANSLSREVVREPFGSEIENEMAVAS